MAVSALGFAVLSGWVLLPAVALRAQEPVVRPADVATPTATPIFPTPTALPLPAPAADGPMLSSTGMDAARGYVVHAGDTLFTVALETGLDIENVPCAIAPGFRPDQPLVIGDELFIPPATLACHTIELGDTLMSIAARYGSTADQLYRLAWNGLAAVPVASVVLVPGNYLRVPLPLPSRWPDASTPSTGELTATTDSALSFLPLMLTMPVNTSPFTLFDKRDARPPRNNQPLGPVPADWPYGSGKFTWPVYGWLSQSYRFDHRALDVAANQGTPVTAADRGVVVRAGWNDQGYGRFVIIDHRIDYVTLYAHLDRILVSEGDVVGQGQVIGTVGSTGNSTGPHLHFEIRDFGRLVNPLELLTVN